MYETIMKRHVKQKVKHKMKLLVVTKKSVASQNFPQSVACLLILLKQFRSSFSFKNSIKIGTHM